MKTWFRVRNIYPAIYPINQSQFAVALIDPRHTSYSGGGRGEELADFIHLQANGKYKTLLKTIPFYSFEQIRACFSEQEYKIEKHCHDESFTTLSIHYHDVGKQFLQWRLSYVHTDWPAGTMNKKITRTKPEYVQFMK